MFGGTTSSIVLIFKALSYLAYLPRSTMFVTYSSSRCWFRLLSCFADVLENISAHGQFYGACSLIFWGFLIKCKVSLYALWTTIKC